MLSGCTTTKYVLVSQVDGYPKFKTEEFKEQKTPKLRIWDESDAEGEYLVATKKDMKAYIKTNKDNRAEYNVLLKRLKIFFVRVEELEEKLKNLKSQDIEDFGVQSLK